MQKEKWHVCAGTDAFCAHRFRRKKAWQLTEFLYLKDADLLIWILQLREKQKAKFIYGVLEKPFRNYYEKADRMKGMTGENLMVLLERRLDNVIFRMGFARTRREARQIVGHKHVLVNGKSVKVPSYLISAGDVIEIKEKAKGMQRYKDIAEATNGRLVPEWMDVDQENFKGTIKEFPSREVIDVPVDEMLIVELYSK